MNIWLLKTGEPVPIDSEDRRLMRMGTIANALIEKKHSVIWFSSTFDHLSKKQLYNKDMLINVKDNFLLYLFNAVEYKKNISINRIINHRQLAKKFEKVSKTIEKPDLILVSFPTIDFAYKAIKYGKKNNVPVVVDIRDLWPDIFNHNLKGIKKVIAKPYIWLMNKKTKRIMEQATAITGISPQVLEWGQKKGNRLNNKSDKYFYNGYKKQESIETVFQEFNITNDDFIVCFAGTLASQFDFSILTETAKIMQNENVKFFICGAGEKYDELKEITKNLNNVTMTGWVDKERLNYILSNSNVGFAPYKNTFDFQMGIPNKFPEYLSYSLPIVVTCDGYMPKLAKENNCGIGSRDINEIKDYILSLKNDKEKYNQESQNARKTYEKNFVADKIYEEMVNYLNNISDNYKKDKT